jgi:murein DD-endopeptidase MepM/ murein hydrolase activator NlpD
MAKLLLEPVVFRRDPLDGLLRKRRRRSRFSVRARVAAGVFILVAAIASVWFLGDDADDAQRVDVEVALVIRTASERVTQSMEEARRPADVVDLSPTGAAADLFVTPKTAVWTEGDSAQLEGVLAKHESLSIALSGRNIGARAIHELVSGEGDTFDFRKSRPGDEWAAKIRSDGGVETFRYRTGPEDVWSATRGSEGVFQWVKELVEVDMEVQVLSGVVYESLWLSLSKAGASPSLSQKFLDLFQYSIDFNVETQRGDRFALVFESVQLDGSFLRVGRILSGRYRGASTSHEGFFFETGGETGGYYDQNGLNLQKQFLKSPLARTRITSRFGKRFHPIDKRMKMHAGVDYGAPTGTMVHALADGIVTWAGWKGANGKLLVLKHANGYTTHYAHLSRIEKGIRKGRRVAKRSPIGRVGSTGRSTGPHLHLGMKRHGKFVNPTKVDAQREEPLQGQVLEDFRVSVAVPMVARMDAAEQEEPRGEMPLQPETR